MGLGAFLKYVEDCTVESWNIVSNPNGWFCWLTERTEECVRRSYPCCTGASRAKEEEEMCSAVNGLSTSAS